MAKSRKKTDGRKAELEKTARQAGKMAARAERVAREAVEKTRETSSMLLDFLVHPSHAATAIGKAVSAGQKSITSGAHEAAAKEKELRAKLEALIDERLKAVVHGLGLPTSDDMQSLVNRVNALEDGKGAPARASARKPAAKAVKPVRKAAKKAAVKPAAKTARRPAARKAAPAKA